MLSNNEKILVEAEVTSVKPNGCAIANVLRTATAGSGSSAHREPTVTVLAKCEKKVGVKFSATSYPTTKDRMIHLPFSLWVWRISFSSSSRTWRRRQAAWVFPSALRQVMSANTEFLGYSFSVLVRRHAHTSFCFSPDPDAGTSDQSALFWSPRQCSLSTSICFCF